MKFQKRLEALEMTHFWAYRKNTQKIVRIVRSSKTLHASIIMPVCRGEMIKTCTRGFYLFSYNTSTTLQLRDNFLGKIVLTLLLMTLMGGTCLLGGGLEPAGWGHPMGYEGGQLFIEATRGGGRQYHGWLNRLNSGRSGPATICQE